MSAGRMAIGLLGSMLDYFLWVDRADSWPRETLPDYNQIPETTEGKGAKKEISCDRSHYIYENNRSSDKMSSEKGENKA